MTCAVPARFGAAFSQSSCSTWTSPSRPSSPGPLVLLIITVSYFLLLEMVLFSVCLYTVLPRTSLVDKDFFNHLYFSHLILPTCASFPFPRPRGPLIEFIINKGFILWKFGHLLLRRFPIFPPFLTRDLALWDNKVLSLQEGLKLLRGLNRFSSESLNHIYLLS